VVLRVGYSGSGLVQPVDGYVTAEAELDWCGHPGRVGGVPVAGRGCRIGEVLPERGWEAHAALHGFGGQEREVE